MARELRRSPKSVLFSSGNEAISRSKQPSFGFLVDPDDEEAFEQAVKRLIADLELRNSMAVWGRIAMETRRSYAACYYSLHRALIGAGVLRPTGIRFVPELSRTWYTGADQDEAAVSAYRHLSTNDLQHRGMVSAIRGALISVPANIEPAGLLFRTGRKIARALFPRSRPRWLIRLSSPLIMLDAIAKRLAHR